MEKPAAIHLPWRLLAGRGCGGRMDTPATPYDASMQMWERGRPPGVIPPPPLGAVACYQRARPPPLEATGAGRLSDPPADCITVPRARRAAASGGGRRGKRRTPPTLAWPAGTRRDSSCCPQPRTRPPWRASPPQGGVGGRGGAPAVAVAVRQAGPARPGPPPGEPPSKGRLRRRVPHCSGRAREWLRQASHSVRTLALLGTAPSSRAIPAHERKGPWSRMCESRQVQHCTHIRMSE